MAQVILFGLLLSTASASGEANDVREVCENLYLRYTQVFSGVIEYRKETVASNVRTGCDYVFAFQGDDWAIRETFETPIRYFRINRGNLFLRAIENDSSSGLDPEAEIRLPHSITASMSSYVAAGFPLRNAGTLSWPSVAEFIRSRSQGGGSVSMKSTRWNNVNAVHLEWQVDASKRSTAFPWPGHEFGDRKALSIVTVPEMGFVVVREECLNPHGVPIYRFEYDQFHQTSSGIWFPSEGGMTTFRDGEPDLTMHYKKVTASHLNDVVPESFFYADDLLASGRVVRVSDTRPGKQAVFQIGGDHDEEIPIESRDLLTVIGTPGAVQPFFHQWGVWMVLGANLAVLVLVVGYLIRRRASNVSQSS